MVWSYGLKNRSIGKELVRRHAFEMVEKELEPGAQARWYMPGTRERTSPPLENGQIIDSMVIC